MLRPMLTASSQGDMLALDESGALFLVTRAGARTHLADDVTGCANGGGTCVGIAPAMSDAGFVLAPVSPPGGELQLRLGLLGALSVIAELEPR